MTNIILGNISSFVNDSTAVTQYNSNNALITTAFSDALSKSGETPNTMSAVLDMNNFNIVNLPSPATINSPVRLVDVINPSVALTVPPVGTSGSTVPLLNGVNTWSAPQTNTSYWLTTKNSFNTAPSSFITPNSYSVAFSGDLTKTDYVSGSQITGVTTLTQPVTGYNFYPNTAPNYCYLSNGSGWNQSTSSNDGRTGVAAYYTKVDQLGQGDTFNYFAQGFVNSSKPGATNWLATPAGSGFTADIRAGTSGCYLSGVGDIDLTDNGFDIAATAFVSNMSRTVNTAALNEPWIGVRIQSVGLSTTPVDAGFSLSGYFNIGLDLADGTYGANNCAIALAANQKIYLNTITGFDLLPNNITLGTTYLFYSSANTGLEYVQNNNSVFLFTQTVSIIYTPLDIGVSQTNYVQILGVGTGISPQINMLGGDTNIGLSFIPKGSGLVQFGNAASFTVNASTATSVTSVGPAGAHTTVQEWLTINNASGVTRYIPCF